jgi:hypothetical protein
MGFRFRRSIKILPGIRLNVSKSGVSTSIGTRGATVNISKRGTRATVGIPGTGISYSSRVDSPRQGDQPQPADESGGGGALLLGLAFIAALIMVAWLIDKL